MAEKKFTKTIAFDFDGVIHSYNEKWQDVGWAPDPPVDGAMEYLLEVLEDGRFNVAIYSSRSREEAGIRCMKNYFRFWLPKKMPLDKANWVLNSLLFPQEKPPAHLSIDDRAYCFTGKFPTLQELDDFVPWNKAKVYNDKPTE